MRQLKVLSSVHGVIQALGVSRELREQGYALMCTSFPMSDAVLEVVEVPPLVLGCSLPCFPWETVVPRPCSPSFFRSVLFRIALLHTADAVICALDRPGGAAGPLAAAHLCIENCPRLARRSCAWLHGVPAVLSLTGCALLSWRRRTRSTTNSLGRPSRSRP